jgi:hypothetical protein
MNSGYGLNWARGYQPKWQRFIWPLDKRFLKLKLKLELKMMLDEKKKLIGSYEIAEFYAALKEHLTFWVV